MKEVNVNFNYNNMKIRNIVTCAIIATIFPFAVISCGDNNASSGNAVVADENENEEKGLNIAYVIIDTLTNQYKLYQEVSANFQQKRDNAEATITQKGKSFASQVEQFQNKARANQLTQLQFENEQARLAKLQQDIQDLEARLSASLQEEYQKELQSLTDTIKNFMSSYAKEKGYDFILCKSSGIDNVLYADEMYDVTTEVVAALNKRYELNNADTEEKEKESDAKGKK